MGKSQTATEYLILLAVVIVISLIVVSVLGGIPSIGGQSNKNVVDAQLKTLPVGIINYAISESETLLEVRNNRDYSVKIDAIGLNGTNCNLSSYPILKSGQSKKLYCSNVNGSSGTSYELSLSINYSDVSTAAKYVQNDSDLNLISIATSTSLSGGSSSGEEESGGGSSTGWQEDVGYDAVSSTGSISNLANIYNGIWTDFGYGATMTTSYIYLNYTLPSGTIHEVKFEHKIESEVIMGPLSQFSLSCYNYSSSSFDLIYDSYVTANFVSEVLNSTFLPDCYSSTPLRIRIKIVGESGGGKFYEQKVWWNVTS